MNFQRLYEDEDLENRIYDIVSNSADYIDVLRKNNHYEYHYFLSPLRHNLFHWYPFKKEGSLLEIGAGYGQLTSLFTQKVDRVVAIEETESKCNIISERAKDATALVSDFDDIKLDEKFDYIVLCNIFEYAKSFVPSENPYVDYLNYLKGFLRDDGVILIALSNRLGLKYFAGFKEEHTDQLFNGISGYGNADYVQTFSKTEISNIINDAGFSDYKFFYPYPNHEFPRVINTDKFINEIPYTEVNQFANERILLFDEVKLNMTLAQDDLSQYFANSFLIEIRSSERDYPTDNIDFIKLGADRKDEFNVYTIIHSDGRVSKSPISAKAINHIRNMYEGSNYVMGKIKFLNAEMIGDSIYYDFLNQENFENIILDAVINNDRDRFFKLIEDFHDALFYNSFESNEYATEEFLEHFKVKSDIRFHCHEKSDLELNFNNLFMIDGEFTAVDYEWFLNFPVPLEMIFIRVLDFHIKHNSLIREFTDLEEICNHFHIDIGNLNLFRTWESNFYRPLINKPPLTKSRIVPLENLDKYDNIQKDIALMNSEIEKKNNEISKKNAEIEKKNNEIKKKDKELKSLLNSNSWKITKPLRKLKSMIKKN